MDTYGKHSRDRSRIRNWILFIFQCRKMVLALYNIQYIFVRTKGMPDQLLYKKPEHAVIYENNTKRSSHHLYFTAARFQKCSIGKHKKFFLGQDLALNPSRAPFYPFIAIEWMWALFSRRPLEIQRIKHCLLLDYQSLLCKLFYIFQYYSNVLECPNYKVFAREKFRHR